LSCCERTLESRRGENDFVKPPKAKQLRDQERVARS
jgi:hypothetical protein